MRFRLLVFCLTACALLLISTPSQTLSQTPPPSIYIPIVARPMPENWRDRLNAYRSLAGVPPVQEDSGLSADCKALAKSMAESDKLNPQSGDPYYPGDSNACIGKSRLWIGRGRDSSNPWQQYNSIDFWMSRGDLRVWLLYPTLPKVGFGFESISDLSRSAAALNVVTHFDEGANDNSHTSWPVKYPADGQTGVPATKYPITLLFPYSRSMPRFVSSEISHGSNVLGHTQDILSTTQTQTHNVIILTPTQDLPELSTISVKIFVEYSDYPGTYIPYKWTFQTGGK